MSELRSCEKVIEQIASFAPNNPTFCNSMGGNRIHKLVLLKVGGKLFHGNAMPKCWCAHWSSWCRRVVVVISGGGGYRTTGGGGYKTGARLSGVEALVEKCSRQFTGDRRQIHTMD